jgi:hypothetical protein
MFRCRPLKGHLIFKRFAVSLKRYPDTKHEFFNKLLGAEGARYIRGLPASMIPT